MCVTCVTCMHLCGVVLKGVLHQAHGGLAYWLNTCNQQPSPLRPVLTPTFISRAPFYFPAFSAFEPTDITYEGSLTTPPCTGVCVCGQAVRGVACVVATASRSSCADRMLPVPSLLLTQRASCGMC